MNPPNPESPQRVEASTNPLIENHVFPSLLKGGTILTPEIPDPRLVVTSADRRLAYWLTGEEDDDKLLCVAQYIRAYLDQVIASEGLIKPATPAMVFAVEENAKRQIEREKNLDASEQPTPSDTPETEQTLHGIWYRGDHESVIIARCRKLERERNALSDALAVVLAQVRQLKAEILAAKNPSVPLPESGEEL